MTSEVKRSAIWVESRIKKLAQMHTRFFFFFLRDRHSKSSRYILLYYGSNATNEEMHSLLPKMGSDVNGVSPDVNKRENWDCDFEKLGRKPFYYSAN